MQTKQSVADKVDAHIRNRGGGYATWYVGIAANPERRLFDEHGVRREGDHWIHVDAGSESAARTNEQHFLRLGCQGGDGGGGPATRHVYAYRIKPHTRE